MCAVCVGENDRENIRKWTDRIKESTGRTEIPDGEKEKGHRAGTLVFFYNVSAAVEEIWGNFGPQT